MNFEEMVRVKKMKYGIYNFKKKFSDQRIDFVNRLKQIKTLLIVFFKTCNNHFDFHIFSDVLFLNLIWSWLSLLFKYILYHMES